MFDLFKSDTRKRVLPNYSVLEITDTRTRLKTELRAALYFYNEEKFIVCSIAGIAEHGEPTVLGAGISDKDLGLSVCDKLLDFEPRNSTDISKSRLDDWAAYKVSGAKSGKAFESNSIYV